MSQKPADYFHPMKNASFYAITGARAFGAGRANGRAHAGVDFLLTSQKNEPVFAAADGIVRHYHPNFYGGTAAINVENDVGTWMRYGEISTSKRVGSRVKRGEQIGYVVPNNIDGLRMLHFEFYEGVDKKGNKMAKANLSEVNNAGTYDFVYPRNYQRRRDLLDPTKIVNCMSKSDAIATAPTRQAASSQSVPTFKLGDKVRIKPGATHYNPEQPIPAGAKGWVYGKTYTVRQVAIMKNGKVQDCIKGGKKCMLLDQISTWVSEENLEKAG